MSADGTSLAAYLKQNNFINNQGEFTNSWDHSSIDEVYSEFTKSVKNIGFQGNTQYYKVLHPLALKTSLF
jgi:hypothetical protein